MSPEDMLGWWGGFVGERLLVGTKGGALTKAPGCKTRKDVYVCVCVCICEKNTKREKCRKEQKTRREAATAT